ncbi:M56 family metallopeptidase [Maribacter arcticus]|uniref:TonB family C-terminal domain-containing protein n=1 Tax=Maribacter arcticus TaxID=561365 RepID=A0A1T5B0Q5_9FLAO|nr:M56 family metallopeptidase [Maribacter arcticus]SKB40794.1 TonB family C-terminal domain-containing protein [Maribacter arcticus]
MIQYILECIAFQLLFLVIYDFFLKRETFFQWNRVYLLGTFLLSLILPWVKIEAFKQQVPQTFAGYPDFLWNLNAVQVVTIEDSLGWQLTWQEGIFYSGMFLALLFFVFKLRQVYLLKKHGEQVQFPNFTQVIITNSSIAFSFFKSIFIGDKVLKMKHDTIIEHELVHIRQGHTWDLLFFELMRIIGWFNPLVYVYQNRVSELHEFIADAHVAKEDKSEQYQQLLSQVFQTEHISFINQFFTKSLIKKRIVMLQKSKSKKVFQLKYLLLLPLVFGMLVYSSCEIEKKQLEELSESADEVIHKEDSLITMYNDLATERWRLLKSADENNPIIVNLDNELKKLKARIDNEDKKNATTVKFEVKEYSDDTEVPFAVVDEVPIFPGCEDAADKRACFNDKIQLHIGKNFSYPKEAQDKGIEGRVSVMFMITSEGVIDNIEMRGPDKLLEDEVERIIKKLPKMTPGKHKGKLVSVPFSIPVNFKLQ